MSEDKRFKTYCLSKKELTGNVIDSLSALHLRQLLARDNKRNKLCVEPVGDCVICSGGSIDTAFIPCGHLICFDCVLLRLKSLPNITLEKIRPNLYQVKNTDKNAPFVCLVCRSEIDKVIKLDFNCS